MGIARLAVLLVLALAPAAHAAGSDPLLSGYGGPGDGEQALLGETLIRESSSGAALGATAQAPAPAPTAIYEADTATPAPLPQETAEPGDEAAAAPARKPSRRPTASKPERPAKPSAPTSQVAVGTGDAEPVSAPAPIAARDLALLVALLLGLLALAGWARRLAVSAARMRRDAVPQRP